MSSAVRVERIAMTHHSNSYINDDESNNGVTVEQLVGHQLPGGNATWSAASEQRLGRGGNGWELKFLFFGVGAFLGSMYIRSVVED